MNNADEVRRLYEMAYDAASGIEQAENFIAGNGICLVRRYTWRERLEEAAKRVEKAIFCANGLLAEINRKIEKDGGAMTDREARIKALMEWVLAAPYAASVVDCDDEAGAEFIARCIARAAPDSPKVIYLLSEFMEEKGIADREEAEGLFQEMFRNANRLMFGYSGEGIWLNVFDMVENRRGKEEKLVIFGQHYFKVLKGNGKVGAE